MSVLCQYCARAVCSAHPYGLFSLLFSLFTRCCLHLACFFTTVHGATKTSTRLSPCSLKHVHLMPVSMTHSLLSCSPSCDVMLTAGLLCKALCAWQYNDRHYRQCKSYAHCWWVPCKATFGHHGQQFWIT